MSGMYAIYPEKIFLLFCMYRQKDERGYNGLHTAVTSDQMEALKWLSNPSNVDALSDSGYTALHIAATNGHVECMEV